jgi:hypothetical protein
MTKTIGFFGASVTAQKNGYAPLLSKKLHEEGIETHIFGYGGNHMDDAGICLIDNVIENKCDFCFIDFFSTGYTTMNDKTIECLDTIVYRFTTANCKLIFLFLLMDVHVIRIPFYMFLKKYLDERNIFYIDINEQLEYSNELCRDNVHTTDLGSEKYADVIFEKFKTRKSRIEYPSKIVETRFCNNKIKSLSINKTFKDKLILRGNGLIIAFYLKIGPKSGLVEINGIKYSIWDIHCHYERSNFKLKNLNVNGDLEIKILQDEIDYSTCRRPIVETTVEKELNVLEIFYIGEDITLID